MNKDLLTNPDVIELLTAYHDFFYERAVFNFNSDNIHLIDDFIKSQLEQQPQKEWEIIAYFYNNEARNAWLFDEGRAVWYVFNGEDFTTHNKPRKEWIIKSVKRLSDGEVFSVGDETNLGAVKDFSVTAGELLVGFEGKESRRYPLNQVTKLSKKQPLFITADGYKIFEENEVIYCVSKQSTLVEEFPSHSVMKQNKYYKYFHSQQAAEEYLINHAQVLSLDDVLNALQNSRANDNKEKLKQLIHSRLNLKS